jgi:hypothetical protein
MTDPKVMRVLVRMAKLCTMLVAHAHHTASGAEGHLQGEQMAEVAEAIDDLARPDFLPPHGIVPVPPASEAEKQADAHVSETEARIAESLRIPPGVCETCGARKPSAGTLADLVAPTTFIANQVFPPRPVGATPWAYLPGDVRLYTIAAEAIRKATTNHFVEWALQPHPRNPSTPPVDTITIDGNKAGRLIREALENHKPSDQTDWKTLYHDADKDKDRYRETLAKAESEGLIPPNYHQEYHGWKKGEPT